MRRLPLSIASVGLGLPRLPVEIAVAQKIGIRLEAEIGRDRIEAFN